MTTTMATAICRATSEVVLPKGAQQFLLPKLAATGRLARIAIPQCLAARIRRSLPAGLGRRPALAVSPGHRRRRREAAMGPQRTASSRKGDSPHLPDGAPGTPGRGGCCAQIGTVPFSGETLPLHAAVTIFKQGIVVFDDRVALLETGGGTGMIERPAKDARAWKCPTRTAGNCCGGSGNCPAAPDVNVPENLRAEEVQMPPQGRLMVDKPERYDPYRLPGRVDFLYGDKAVSPQDASRANHRREARAGDRPRPAAGARTRRFAGRAARAAHGRLASREIQRLGQQHPCAPPPWSRSSTRAGSSRPKVSISAARARGG